MFEETSIGGDAAGLSERRATTVVTIVLIVETIWVFLHKYLPMDAGLWALQAELVHKHLFSSSHDGWKLIPFPAANVGAPFFSGLLTLFFSGEVAVRLMMTVGAIFLRGYGILTLFRVLKVRDESIYYLIPVLTLSGIWFTGALPYLMGETLTLWVLAFFLSQDRPQSYAYWIISTGLFFIALCHALLFLLAAFVVVLVMMEQRRSVHLSQGWLSSPRSVMSLLIPGALLVLLGLFAGEPIFRISSSNLIPLAPFGRFIFLITPAPDILEATFRYGDVLHGLLAILLAVVVVGSFARAYFLAIEEVTWQSCATRTAGYVLLILAALSGLLAPLGIETASWLTIAVILILGGAYSRGPAVRRTPLDRLLFLGSSIILICSALLNGFSIELGSSAAQDVIKSSRRLITQERQTALEDEHRDSISIRFVLDSGLVQSYANHSVGTLSYTETSPIYLFGETDLLKTPWAMQPSGGMVRTNYSPALQTSPAVAVRLGSSERYTDSSVRVLAALPHGTFFSATFSPFEHSLVQDGGISVDKGEASYRLSIGKLRQGRPIEMAMLR